MSSVHRKSRTASMASATGFNELRTKWDLWCEEEGVDDPPHLVKVDSLKRTRYSIVPIVEQTEDEYVKSCSVDNRTEEALRDSRTEIQVQFDGADPVLLRGLQVKGKLVSAPLSSAVGRIIEHYQTLTTVKLIKCSLVAESLHMLGYVLKNSNVSQLYLDENVIPTQNYHLILEENNKLLHYSLRLTMITDCGAELLAKNLQYSHPYHQILRSLNLNCNLIDDDGACALARALRWNRNLTCLALAGNRIGDRGAIALAKIFLPFTLTTEELEFRAEIICDRLLKVKTIMEESSISPNRKQGSKDAFQAPPPSYPGETADLNDLMIYYYALEKWAEDQVPPVSNPIVTDVTESDDGQYVGKGNDALCYLNLSYNLLTEDALLVFLEVMKHQENAIAEFDRKLWRFEYHGNPYDSEHPVLEELELYLNPYRSLISLHADGSRKGSAGSLKSRLSKDKVQN